MFQFLSVITAIVIPYGNILTFYKDRSCSMCDEIEKSLIEKNLKYNLVDCDNEENCPKTPQLNFTKNGTLISQKNDLSILNDIVQDIEITELKGPWFILFYEDNEENIEKYLQKAALDFPELNVGKIHSSKVPKRYEINKYPSIIAFWNSLKKVYEYSLNNLSLGNFIRTLLENFSELTLSEFYKIKTHVFFIVFYQNEEIANYHFRQIAHNYKFTARFYKSADPELIKLAGIDFLKLRSPQKSTSDVLVLSVYKKRRFHKLIITKFNEEIINEWVFHSHYSHLTRVNNENFYTIFHAYKPVILLLTRKEQLCEELEIVSEDLHEVRPFMSYIFAVVDIDQMTSFIDTLLPGLTVPKILIYDPSKFLYYVHDDEIKDVKEYVNMLIAQYEKQILKPWPRAYKSKLKLRIYGLIAVFIIISVFMVRKAYERKIKLH